VLLDFYLPLVMFSCRRAVEVRGEGVLVPPRWVVISGGVSDLGVRDAGMIHVERMDD